MRCPKLGGVIGTPSKISLTNVVFSTSYRLVIFAFQRAALLRVTWPIAITTFRAMIVAKRGVLCKTIGKAKVFFILVCLGVPTWGLASWGSMNPVVGCASLSTMWLLVSVISVPLTMCILALRWGGRSGEFRKVIR